MRSATRVGSENEGVDSACRDLNVTDPWLLSSALQKSVRRGETELAASAAGALYRVRGSSIWRRLQVIAIEDVGVARPETLIEVNTICSDRSLRRKLGSDEDAARFIARRLASVPKCRTADLLASAVCYHPALETIRNQVHALSSRERLSWVLDPCRSFYERSVAAWFASGMAAHHKHYNWADLRSLLTVFEDLGAPRDLIEAIAGAASRTREPFCAFVPLLWLGARSTPEHGTVHRHLPPTRTVGGLPLWTLDFHTRAGRVAIQRFARENEAIGEALRESVVNSPRAEAAYLGAFYADAVCCAVSLDWPLNSELEQLGMEADFARAGVSPERVRTLLSAFESHIEALNNVREEVLVRYLEGQ